jgi:pyruvate,orthophosphate dikinase
VFNSDDAAKWAEEGEDVILTRIETSPDDIVGMKASKGFLTSFGGIACHAAVVARGMGKTCVVGCDAINIDYKAKTMTVNGKVYKEGDYISLNGTEGNVYKGKIDLIKPKITKNFMRILKWARKYKRMQVKTNAEEIPEIKKALKFGAEGIGLCRTEHMFF